MKLLLLMAALIFGTAIQAQQVRDIEKLRERARQFEMTGKDRVQKKDITIFLSREGKVIQVLPQDGMPYIIPDTRGIAAIPNAFRAEQQKDPLPGQIPNGWMSPKPRQDADATK